MVRPNPSVRFPEFNQQYTEIKSKQLDYSVNIEPFNDFKIDLVGNRIISENFAENYNINNGVFDASALVHIINGGTFTFAGSYVSDLSGSVNIQNITEIVNLMLSKNVYDNHLLNSLLHNQTLPEMNEEYDGDDEPEWWC